MSAYSQAFGCFLLFWGRVADIYGMKRIFVWGTAWVALTSLLNPFVTNEIAFDLVRGLQGLVRWRPTGPPGHRRARAAADLVTQGAAANVPTALGILGTTFRPGKAKTYAFAAYGGFAPAGHRGGVLTRRSGKGAGAPLGSIFGNILAGVISGYSSWRWVFGSMAILSGVIAVAGLLVIPDDQPTDTEKGSTARAGVDWIGAVLITTGLFALLFALTEVNVVGWTTYWIPILMVGSLLSVALFVVWQIRLEQQGQQAPLMKVSVFRSAQFSTAMLIMTLFSSSFNGFLVYATYFYQGYQGLDALQTTLRFIPTGVAGIVASIAVAFALDTVPTWLILLLGNACVALASLLFAVPLPGDTSYWAYGAEAMSLAVLGSDTTWPSMTLFTSHALPQQDQALGGALVNAVGQVGRSLGLAAATAVQIAVMGSARGVGVQDAGPVLPWDEPTLAGLRAGAWFNFGVGACSVTVIALMFRGTGIIGRDGMRKA